MAHRNVNSRTKLIDYCLRRLGHPVIEINITPNSNSDMNRCTYFLILICFFGSCFSNSSISTQNDVVSEVSAESALEYAAAIIPTINNTPTYSGSPALRAMFGNSMSGLLGIKMLKVSEYKYSNAPKERKSRSV